MLPGLVKTVQNQCMKVMHKKNAFRGEIYLTTLTGVRLTPGA